MAAGLWQAAPSSMIPSIPPPPQGVSTKIYKKQKHVNIQTVENVISGIDTKTSVPSVSDDPKPTISSRITKSTEHVICRDLIETLWQENWFTKERNLSEVDEELSRRGYHYDKTSISHSLKDLVRENILTRNGSMRNYRYVQKRPPLQ